MRRNHRLTRLIRLIGLDPPRIERRSQAARPMLRVVDRPRGLLVQWRSGSVLPIDLAPGGAVIRWLDRRRTPVAFGLCDLARLLERVVDHGLMYEPHLWAPGRWAPGMEIPYRELLTRPWLRLASDSPRGALGPARVEALGAVTHHLGVRLRARLDVDGELARIQRHVAVHRSGFDAPVPRYLLSRRFAAATLLHRDIVQIPAVAMACAAIDLPTADAFTRLDDWAGVFARDGRGTRPLRRTLHAIRPRSPVTLNDALALRSVTLATPIFDGRRLVVIGGLVHRGRGAVVVTGPARTLIDWVIAASDAQFEAALAAAYAGDAPPDAANARRWEGWRDAREDPRPPELTALLQQALDLRAGLVPAPARGPSGLVAVVRRVLARRVEGVRQRGGRLRMGSLPAPTPETVPDATALARPPMGLEGLEGARLLTTVGEIRAEGGSMRHCVESYIDDCLWGRAFLFHYEAGGIKATGKVDAVTGEISTNGPRNVDNSASEALAVLLERWRARWPEAFLRGVERRAEQVELPVAAE